MSQTQTTQTIFPSDAKIVYSWTKGWLFYRIERTFLPDGQCEVVAYIPRWFPDAEWITINATRGLSWGVMFNR